jgi:hypothetical protein
MFSNNIVFVLVQEQFCLISDLKVISKFSVNVFLIITSSFTTKNNANKHTYVASVMANCEVTTR